MGRLIRTRRSVGHAESIYTSLMLPYNAKHAEGRPFAREQPMHAFDILWDLDDDPEGNVQHIAEHGITVDDVEEVLSDPDASIDVSKSSGRSITFGETSDGRYLAVVWETALDDPLTIYPVTAYPAPRPGKRRR
jgi:uncharacterized DUF497 family protein